MRLAELWRGIFRTVVGIFWLYFASQKWGGVGWMQPLIQGAAGANPIPGLHELLAVVVAPNWFLFAVLQAVAETVVGVLLLLGFATRKAAVLGLLLALILALVSAFDSHDIGSRWLCYLALRANPRPALPSLGSPAPAPHGGQGGDGRVDRQRNRQSDRAEKACRYARHLLYGFRGRGFKNRRTKRPSHLRLVRLVVSSNQDGDWLLVGEKHE